MTAWNAASDTTARLRTAGLLGVFDPDAWQFAARCGPRRGAVGRVRRQGPRRPQRCPHSDRGTARAVAGQGHRRSPRRGSSDAALAGLRNVMGKELARLFGGGISGGAATFDLSEWAPHVAGLRHAGVELMVLVEHDLLSLRFASPARSHCRWSSTPSAPMIR